MEKQLFVTKDITQVSASDLEGVGTVRWKGGKCYRWVQNKHTVATAIGDLVFHSYANGATFLMKVYDGATNDLGAMAGVAVSVIAVDGYGWIQANGVNEAVSVLKSNTAIAIGDKLKGVEAKFYGVQMVAMGAAAVHERYIEAMATLVTTGASATATIRGFVRCL